MIHFNDKSANFLQVSVKPFCSCHFEEPCVGLCNFDLKLKVKCVPSVLKLESRVWESNWFGSKQMIFSTLNQKRRQNGYLVEFESFFSCHPKCKEKANMLELELRTFGSICSCCVHAESFSSFDAKCNMNCFLCNIRTITFAKIYIALCKLTGQIFSGFLHRLTKR